MNIKGYTKTQATNLLYSGGLKVYTTQDSAIQNILDEEYTDPSNFPDQTQYELDFALTVTDPEGNQVNYSKEMLQLSRMRIRILIFSLILLKKARLM